MRTILVCVFLVGCLKSQSVTCEDGTICPQGTVCEATHHVCVTQDQIDKCQGQADGTACHADPIDGFCAGGVCFAQLCGDSIVVGTEVCDDGNQRDGDGCSGNCASTEACGNSTLDPVHLEECDDGNLLDHDGCSSRCKLESPHWIKHSIAPSPRTDAAVANDTTRDRIVVFGGRGPGVTFDETLEWTGADWITAAPAQRPNPRAGAAMAYDPDLGVTLMFGGVVGTSPYRDLWAWDGANWKSADATVSPPARYAHVMAYDPRRHVLVIFGGNNGNDASYLASMGDTWEWDGTTWIPGTGPQPGKRYDASMVYDPKIGKIVMTGGYDSQHGGYADTWTYDGTWHDVTSGPNPHYSNAMMTYDLVSQRVVLFGGYDNGASTVSNLTWTWNGATWSSATFPSTTAPALTARYSGVLGSTRTQVVLLGGTGAPQSDTWLLAAANTWAQASTIGPRYDVGVANDVSRGRIVVHGGYAGTSTLSALAQHDTWELGLTGFVLRAAAPPTLLPGAGMTYDPARKEVVLAGLTSANLPETWIWNGAGWTKKTPATLPRPRNYAPAAFDGQDVTLVGGSSPTNATLGDLESWDGTTWSHGPTLWPQNFTGIAAGYDPVRKQLVAFGGNINLTDLDETWTYDHADQQMQHMPGFAPTARAGAALVWNPARTRLTLLCGGGPFSCDSYEWDGNRWHVVPTSSVPVARIGHGVASSPDGAGVMMFGGRDPYTSPGTVYDERWELKWDGPGAAERCDGADLDGDGLVGCADPDCWAVCTPLCPPGQTCDPNGPRCGDGTCDATRETCITCAADCGACPALCGDDKCDASESCLGDCP